VTGYCEDGNKRSDWISDRGQLICQPSCYRLPKVHIATRCFIWFYLEARSSNLINYATKSILLAIIRVQRRWWHNCE